MNENHYIGLVVQPYREGFTSHEVTKQSAMPMPGVNTLRI